MNREAGSNFRVRMQVTMVASYLVLVATALASHEEHGKPFFSARLHIRNPWVAFAYIQMPGLHVLRPQFCWFRVGLDVSNFESSSGDFIS